MANLIYLKERRWKDFIDSIAEGESITVSVDSCADIDIVRAVASKINTTQRKPYKYTVKGDNGKQEVTIRTI